MSLTIEHIRKMQEARRKRGPKQCNFCIKTRAKTTISPQPAPLDPRIAKVVSEAPESMRATYLKAVSGKSAKAAVKAFCWECQGWDRAGVRNCTSPACPLYPYRPGASR